MRSQNLTTRFQPAWGLTSWKHVNYKKQRPNHNTSLKICNFDIHCNFFNSKTNTAKENYSFSKHFYRPCVRTSGPSQHLQQNLPHVHVAKSYLHEMYNVNCSKEPLCVHGVVHGLGMVPPAIIYLLPLHTSTLPVKVFTFKAKKHFYCKTRYFLLGSQFISTATAWVQNLHNYNFNIITMNHWAILQT